MRAVARGLFLETLPACPEACGGRTLASTCFQRQRGATDRATAATSRFEMGSGRTMRSAAHGATVLRRTARSAARALTKALASCTCGDAPRRKRLQM